MAEPESLSVVAESLCSQESKPSAISTFDATGTHPLHNIYAVDTDDNKSTRKYVGPEDLPSKRLQFSQWHELRRTEVKGNQLKAPRIRIGPPEHDRDFNELVDEDDEKIHHDLDGRPRKRHRDNLEAWETAKLASFTRQEMQHGYQNGSLDRVLSRLRNVIYLNLYDNEITSLSSHSFPKCEYLNVDDNYMTSIKQFPKVSKVIYLSARSNGIYSLNGLSTFASSPLEELILAENPITFQIGYRYKVFFILPKLKMLDGVLKQPEDSTPPKDIPPELQDHSCIIL